MSYSLFSFYTMHTNIYKFKTDGVNTESILCGFTPCSVYSNQLLSDPIMNGTDSWYCNNCNLDIDDESYDGRGFIIKNRNAIWKGLTQELSPSLG